MQIYFMSPSYLFPIQQPHFSLLYSLILKDLKEVAISTLISILPLRSNIKILLLWVLHVCTKWFKATTPSSPFVTFFWCRILWFRSWKPTYKSSKMCQDVRLPHFLTILPSTPRADLPLWCALGITQNYERIWWCLWSLSNHRMQLQKNMFWSEDEVRNCQRLLRRWFYTMVSIFMKITRTRCAFW